MTVPCHGRAVNRRSAPLSEGTPLFSGSQSVHSLTALCESHALTPHDGCAQAECPGGEACGPGAAVARPYRLGANVGARNVQVCNVSLCDKS